MRNRPEKMFTMIALAIALKFSKPLRAVKQKLAICSHSRFSNEDRRELLIRRYLDVTLIQ